jgi:glycosyltransferase involved in cell wall biosynthesis
VKVVFTYYQFLDTYGKRREIGGVETYIWNLSELCRELGWEPCVVQHAAHRFKTQVNHLPVIGVASSRPSRQWGYALYEVASSLIDADKDILIFGADTISIPTRNRRAIAIQHGIHWDLPVRFICNRRRCKAYWGRRLEKWRAARRAIRNFNNCYNRVCVDYNFLNWYRATLPDEPHGRIWVIPNCVHIPSVPPKRSRNPDTIRIIFARRFTEYRGTRLIAEVILALMKEHRNLQFTFAGSGPDEEYLRSAFRGYSNVEFVQYVPEDAISVLSDYDIAVVPSLASEGTTLSVAEAMGTGVVVVATAVGGITNMVIDGYNGMLASPTVESFREKLETVIVKDTLRRVLAENALKTAKCAFSHERWNTAWRQVLTEVAGTKNSSAL